MSTRVTTMSMQTQSLTNLQTHMGRMAKLQDQMTTGRAFTKPSENPTATVTAMRVRSDQRVNAQFERNIVDGETWVSSVDSAIQNSTEMLRQVRDLTVQGSSTGTYGPSQLRSLAAEIRGISGAMLQQANSQVSGRSLFAGTSDAPSAFEADGTYNGAPGTVERRISDATTVRVDADGAAVFGQGTGSVFAMLEELASTLEKPGVKGEEISAFLGKIDGRMESMVNELALVGTRHNQLRRAESDIGDAKVSLEAQRSSVEDVDLAESVVKLSLQEMTYQSSLSATSRSLQNSLLDFLR